MYMFCGYVLELCTLYCMLIRLVCNLKKGDLNINKLMIYCGYNCVLEVQNLRGYCFLWVRFGFVGSKEGYVYFCGNNADCVYNILKCVHVNHYLLVYVSKIQLGSDDTEVTLDFTHNIC